MVNSAVFVDFENLYLSLKSRNDGTGHPDAGAQPAACLEGMLARLREEGASRW